MIAILAGTGSLPGLLVQALDRAGEEVLVAALAGFEPDLPEGTRRLSFRIENFGTLLNDLKEAGVSHLCLAGAIRRPAIDPTLIDAATAPLVPRFMAALGAGDDGALRIILEIIAEQGIEIVGAHDLLPGLLPAAGVPTRAQPEAKHGAALAHGRVEVARLGAADVGQACVVSPQGVLASEGAEGTDAMLAALGPVPPDAMLYKAPKPGQDLRADMPVIGPATARAASRAGLSGMAVSAGDTMVIGLEQIVSHLDAHGLFLWIVDGGAGA